MEDPIMAWLSHIILGLLQGLTEIFPVSSTAHTTFGRGLWASFTGYFPASFADVVFLHLGTCAAILVWYRRDVLTLLRSAGSVVAQRWSLVDESDVELHPLGRHTPWLMLLSLGVTGILGIALKTSAVYLFETPTATTALLFVNGLGLLTIGGMESGSRRIRELNWRDYVLIGALQGIAVLPGLSRFGLTLCTALLLGLEWYQALKLSFLLSLPTVFAAAGFEWFLTGTSYSVPPLALVAGATISAATAWFAIRIMRKYSLYARRKLVYFGLYCVTAAPFYGLYLWYLR